MSCVTLRKVIKKGLCPKDLNKQVEVTTRSIPSSGFGTAKATTIEFTKIADFMCGIETLNPVSRQFLKGIDDKITHIFFFNYSTRLSLVDSHSTYIIFRDTYYKMESFYNDAEDNRFIALMCSYRGSKTEAEAKV